MYWEYSYTSLLNIPPVTGKNEMDVAFNENKQVNANEVFYGHCSNWPPYFSGQQGGDVKKLTTLHWQNVKPLGTWRQHYQMLHVWMPVPQSLQLSLHQGYQKKQKDNKKVNYLFGMNIVLMRQQKQEDNGYTFLVETLGSTILDSGACWTKFYKCFLENTQEKQKQPIKVQTRVRT